MSKQDLIKEKWDKDYKNKKINDGTNNTIKATINEWKAWVNKITSPQSLQWFELDMKNCSNEKPRPPKPLKTETDKEKIKDYCEWKYKEALAKYINNRQRPKVLGSWLKDHALFLCGDSITFSGAFGVWTKYDVEESFKNIKDIFDYEEPNDYSKFDCDKFIELLETKELDCWLVKEPYQKEAKIDEEKAKEIAKESIEKLKKIIDAKTIEQLKEQERNNFLSDGMRHKIMMLQSISYDETAKDYSLKLLFKNKIGDDVIEWLASDGNKPSDTDWVTNSVWVIDNMCELLEINEKRNISIIKNIGSLVWSLNLEEEFANIDDKNYKQIVYTGAPGTGKTYGITDYVKSACIKNPLDNETINEMEVSIDQYKFVQFHSSYDYSDFVEGLRPVQLQEGQNPTFVRMDGVFKKFCRNIVEYNNKYNELHEEEIKNDTHKKAEETTSFYFIIDEINRADLGKVFGELMYGLEESYRGKDHAFDTQYTNLATYIENPSYGIDKYPGRVNTTKEDKYVPIKKIKEDVFAEGFYIPENLRIIGSMNDIDRSVETFDFALRRRFQWKEISANDKDKLERVLESMFDKNDAADAAYGNKDELVKRIIGMNEVISGEDHSVEINGSNFGFGEAYQIGPAYFKSFNGYFTKKDTPKDVNGCCLEVIWEEKIEPTIREYVRGRMPDQIDRFIKECRDKLIVELKDDDNVVVSDSVDTNIEDHGSLQGSIR